MADILKKYRNKSGYTIKATEKAYNLFYKKQGFAPAEDPAASDSDEKDPTAGDPDKKDPAASDSDEKDPTAGDPDKKDPAAGDLNEKDSVFSDPTPKEPVKKTKGKSTKAADKDATKPETSSESTQEE